MGYLIESEAAARLAAVQRLLQDKQLDLALVYYDEFNIGNGWYLTGWCPQFESGAVLVPAKGRPLLLGGPVGTQMLFYVHTLGPEIIPEAIDVGDGVWFGGDFDAMKRYLELGGPVEGRIKFIIGYSGWSKGQIADELRRHDWAVLDNAGCDILMGEGDDNMWREAVSMFGDRYRLWLSLPNDPTNN